MTEPGVNPAEAWRGMGSAAARAAAELSGLTDAVREGEAQDERELLTFHPDVIDLDLKDAAWNPEP